MFARITVALFVIASVPEFRLAAGETEPSAATIRAAINKSIPLLEKASAGSAEQRTCFTCHSQGVPVFAFVEAKRRGFTVDEDNLQRQLDHTLAHLKRGKQAYLKKQGQGGKELTAGYALWTLEAGGHQPDELTAAVAGFILDYQKKNGHWSHGGNRPPSSGSNFTATYVSLRGLAVFGTEEQSTAIDERKKIVRQWLLDTPARDTEDRVFRLRSLHYADADEKAIGQAAEELASKQRDDGGWAQTAEMKSDAYATSTALVALLRDGGLSANDPTVTRGINYLLQMQLDDGSWHVVTRAKGFQKYFESGYPHGKDQFISTAAAGWATAALLLVLPE